MSGSSDSSCTIGWTGGSGSSAESTLWPVTSWWYGDGATLFLIRSCRDRESQSRARVMAT